MVTNQKVENSAKAGNLPSFKQKRSDITRTRAYPNPNQLLNNAQSNLRSSIGNRGYSKNSSENNSMDKAKISYICSSCGWSSPKWAGQCRSCQEWGTIEEVTEESLKLKSNDLFSTYSSLISNTSPIPLTEIDSQAQEYLPTGLSELDRVLGRGLVPGAVVLLSGEPGVGKSTLLLELAKSFLLARLDQGSETTAAAKASHHNATGTKQDTGAKATGADKNLGSTENMVPATKVDINRTNPIAEQQGSTTTAGVVNTKVNGRLKKTQAKAKVPGASHGETQAKVLYITGEESVRQVKLRADRIRATDPNILLASENTVEAVLTHLQHTLPELVIVDSIQTISSSGLESQSGSVNQVKTVASKLIQAAKATHTPIIIVGHVTKDGTVAGPRTLEHLVDVVLSFEGDKASNLRILRSSKNRYGSTEEIGCFSLTERGISQIVDPSKLFLSQTGENPGATITVVLEGNRPLITEIQALVAPGGPGNPRRSTSGVNTSRVVMILAVLQAHLSLDLSSREVYVSTVGGARAMHPGVDLPIAIATLSALFNQPVPRDLISFGEVGLTSDIRSCAGISRRLQEAARLGYKRAIIPELENLSLPELDIDIVPVKTLKQVMRLIFGSN